MSWLSEFLRLFFRPRPVAPKPAPRPVPPPTGTDAEIIVSLLNGVRSRPIALDAAMCADAQQWATTMAQSVGLRHRSPLPPGVYGEIIAQGYSTPQDAFAGWRSSSGHNRIMLDPSYSQCGFARSGDYWAGVFA